MRLSTAFGIRVGHWKRISDERCILASECIDAVSGVITAQWTNCRHDTRVLRDVT